MPLLVGGVALAAALGAGGYWVATHEAAAPLLAAVKHHLASSVLAKSGFFAAFRWGTCSWCCPLALQPALPAGCCA